MYSIQFDAKTRWQGNSLVITLPAEIRETYNLQGDEVLRIYAKIMSGEEIKKEEELRNLTREYPIILSGKLFRDGEEIGTLDEVFARKIGPIRSGHGGDLDAMKWVDITYFKGFIKKGFLTAESFSYYEKTFGFNNDWVNKNLTANEEMVLRDEQGNEYRIIHLEFDGFNLGVNRRNMNVVKFEGRLIKGEEDEKAK